MAVTTGGRRKSAPAPVVETAERNPLTELGEKIFLDRYALKDMAKTSLAPGDVVVVCVDTKTGQREIGTARSVQAGRVTVDLRDGQTVERAVEHVDKPLETRPAQMMARVARGIAAAEDERLRPHWQAEFEWLLQDWKFVPGGRILTAAGTDQELTYYNCYVVPMPQDSRRGIVDTLSQMMEIMSRGGGVGINVSSLRPRHAYVKGVNGRSSGSVSWGALYSFVTGLIEQGGSRRGALMLILNVWHPDVMDFIHSKREMGKITNANISVGITDDFMAAVNDDADWNLIFPDTSDPEYDTLWNGDLNEWKAAGRQIIVYKTVRAREVWDAIIESAWASAEPGVFFVDRYNRMSNSHYFAPIWCTNPCVTGDTLIYTGSGLRRADELWLGAEAARVIVDGRRSPAALHEASPVICTGIKPVFQLRTREGYELRLTADHRVMTDRGWVPASELALGDRVHVLNRPGGFGNEGGYEEGCVLGWMAGDGSVKADEAELAFFGLERALAGRFAAVVNTGLSPAVNNRESPIGVVAVKGRVEARVPSRAFHEFAAANGLDRDSLQVPSSVLAGSRAMQMGFLQGLFSADGTVQRASLSRASVRLASKSATLLQDVQRLLLNFGIFSRIYRNRKEEELKWMPDGSGGRKQYRTAGFHELAVSKDQMDSFYQEIGFLVEAKQNALHEVLGRSHRGPYMERFVAHFESLEADGCEPVYDLTEPTTHSFIGNGIVVHNCGEQGLPAWGVCNLGALNLAKFVKDSQVDWDLLGRGVRSAVRFLDDVIDSTPYFFEENKRQQLSERRVGMGIMGLAEMLIRIGLRYGSDECCAFLDDLLGFIASEAYRASSDNAREKGAFPQFDAEKFLASGFMQGMPEDVRQKIRQDGCRNVTLLTVAPTGTTGTMVNTSTGVEPFFSWSFYRKSRLGVHEESVAVAKEWQDAHPGEPLPDFFVTAMDLAPEDHVRTQAAIQRWIDSSLSKTCNVPKDYTVAQTRELYELMYRLGCKGGTVYRDGSRDEQVLSLKEDGGKSAPAEPVPVPVEKVRPRPYKRRGVTVSKPTPTGTAHITMNDDEQDHPFEVFLEIGKAGSDIKAMSEAMGRLMSLVLRLASPLSPEDRVQAIVDQIKGIGGARHLGFGKDRVRSLPDAVAQALEEHYLRTGVEESLGPPHRNGHAALMSADLCPSCGEASFVHEEGCQICHACGYSEC